MRLMGHDRLNGTELTHLLRGYLGYDHNATQSRSGRRRTATKKARTPEDVRAHKAHRACTRYSASNSAIAASSESVAWMAGSKTFVEMGRPLTFTAALMAETNRSHTS